MKLTITNLADKGMLPKERIVLKAKVSVDLGRYALYRTKVSNGRPTTGVSDVFWFPDERAEAGDLVVLYTKEGTENKRALKSGATSHFFYWHRDEALWDDSDFAPVVVFTPDWELYSESD